MKKAITILAILIVVVSAVFADLPTANDSESHTIRLKTIVQSVLPQFQLSAEITTGAKTNSDDTAQTNPNGTGTVSGDSNDFVNTGAYLTLIDVADISETDIVADVTASLVNTAKTGGVYRLDFNPGAFENLWWYDAESGKVQNTAGHYKHIDGVISDLEAGEAGTGHSVVENGDYSVKVKFNGQETEALDLATFTVTYEKDTTIVDNNGTGYTADIVMTVTFEG